MIAPQSITSNLRRMSDQQLAQYAKMHANDPYIFPLAFQESQDRKSMRSEAMARQSGQMPPPVVQQDLAQMMPQQAPQMPQQAQLPEEQGIGALPAQNMQGMAGGGITGEHHFRDGGYNYNTLKESDLPSDIAPEDIAARSKALLESAQTAAAPENLKTSALFDPFIAKLSSKQADIEERKNNNTNLALLQAGLGMMGGTSQYGLTNIAHGAQQGLSAYISGKKAIDDAQDTLDHSQFLMAQAKDAALKGNVQLASANQNAALAQLQAGQHQKLAGMQLLNSSEAKGAELQLMSRKNDIEAQKAANEAAYRTKYLDVLGSTKPSQEDKKLETVMARVNSDPLIKNLAAQLDPKNALVQPGTQEYNNLVQSIYKRVVPYYTNAGLEPPEMGALDPVTQTIPKQGFWDKLFHGTNTSASQQNATVQTPGMAQLTDEDSGIAALRAPAAGQPVPPLVTPGTGGWSIRPIQ